MQGECVGGERGLLTQLEEEECLRGLLQRLRG